MDQPMKRLPTRQKRQDDQFGAGNELFVRFLRLHDKLSADHSKTSETTEEIKVRRRSWRSSGRRLSNSTGFEWTMPEKAQPDAENNGSISPSMAFFAVDDKPFLSLRIEANEIRSVRQDANLIVEGRQWMPVEYDVPAFGGVCLIDLAPLKSLDVYGKGVSVQFDRDGSIIGHFCIDPAKFYVSMSVHGGISGVSGSGVVRGWATITADRSRDVLLVATIDKKEKAYFYAREAYDASGQLRMFNFQIPKVFLNGELHRLDIKFVGGNVSLEGSPVFFIAKPTSMFVLSSPHFENAKFSAEIMETTNVPLNVQSAAIDAARIANTSRLLASPSWIATAPLRVFSRLARGTRGASLSASNVSVANRRHLREQILKTQSWRVSAPLRAILNRFGGADNRLRQAAEDSFGPPVICALQRSGRVVFEGEANDAAMPENAFSAGFSRFTAPLAGEDLGSTILALSSGTGGAVSEVPMQFLKSLSED